MNARFPDIDERLQATLDSATETVKRAHERCQIAVRRAREIRDALQKARNRPSGSPASGRQTAILELAAEESARSVHEKDRLLAVASHELRQPLTAAQAALEVIELDRSGDQATRARAVLRRQLSHMSRLVDDLLAISRDALSSSELTKTRIDLRQIIERALETTASSVAAAGLSLDVVVPSEPIWIEGDEARLVQALTNLLANAVRYTPSGGRVALAVKPHDDLIVIEVADTGRGMDAGDLARVFEPFARGQTTTGDGFGIGLALARGIVERHGGSVAAVSDGLDRGSRFTVVLPACQ